VRRDSIFFRVFKQYPTLLFDLLETPPSNAAEYRFDSVAVKEPKFEIDGIFLPPETSPPGTVYLTEVQFQHDPVLYERLFAELFFYLQQNRDRFSDWQVVVIYPKRSIEQSQTQLYRALLHSEQVHRIYLNELGDVAHLPLGLALMVLTTLDKRQTPKAARLLVERAQHETQSFQTRGIIEMITTIMVYRFTNLTRPEIEKMLANTIQETRVYQDAKAEGELIGEERGEKRGKQLGRLEGERNLILKLLTRQLGEIPDSEKARVKKLKSRKLEALGEALLDFQTLADFETWLQVHG
jgi:predicted transposase/invertase (TIGR01784 family)